MKKYPYFIFVLFISLFFFSCSGMLNSDKGKIVFNLPYGRAISEQRAADDSVSYVFYLRFENSTAGVIYRTGKSNDSITIDEAQPGKWTVNAVACAEEYKESFDILAANAEKDSDAGFYTVKNSDNGFAYYQGSKDFDVTAGGVTNVTLTLQKVSQITQKESLKVEYDADSFGAITSENFEDFMKTVKVYDEVITYTDDVASDPVDTELTSDAYTYTKPEETTTGDFTVTITYVKSDDEKYTADFTITITAVQKPEPVVTTKESLKVEYDADSFGTITSENFEDFMENVKVYDEVITYTDDVASDPVDTLLTADAYTYTKPAEDKTADFIVTITYVKSDTETLTADFTIKITKMPEIETIDPEYPSTTGTVTLAFSSSRTDDSYVYTVTTSNKDIVSYKWFINGTDLAADDAAEDDATDDVIKISTTTAEDGTLTSTITIPYAEGAGKTLDCVAYDKDGITIENYENSLVR